MKVLGISGSPRKKSTSGTYKLVKTVVENTGCEYEIVSLRGKQISGCIACLGCAKDNICKVKDDLRIPAGKTCGGGRLCDRRTQLFRHPERPDTRFS
jgi:hypothetical protein